MNLHTVTYNNLSFVNIHNPGELELKYLNRDYGFSKLDLEDFANKVQIPKVELFKRYSLIVLDFPVYQIPRSFSPKNGTPPPSRNPLSSILSVPQEALSSFALQSPTKKKRVFGTQVYFFIGKEYLVVLHDNLLSPINEIFSECQKSLRNRNDYMSQGPVFLAYRLIDALVDGCFPILNELSATIERIDRQLEEKDSQDTIEDISVTRRNIVYFQTMIKPIIPIFRQLEEGRYKELNGTMRPYWSNVMDHLQKLWNRLEDGRELIEGIAISNESLLTYRTNEIVKFLTVITSVSFPFIIVNNLYSMNITGLPFAHEPYIVWVLFGIIFISGIAIILYFMLRRWL